MMLSEGETYCCLTLRLNVRNHKTVQEIIYTLFIIQFRLQDLTVVFHGLYVAHLIGLLLNSSGVDVPVSQDCRRHCELMRKLTVQSLEGILEETLRELWFNEKRREV